MRRTGRGFCGRATAHGIQEALGVAAPLAPLLLTILGAIVFLEINVPRLIASYGTAAFIYALAFDALLGRQGGIIGRTLAEALNGLLGDTGGIVFIVLALLLLTAGLFKVSVKRAIGWVILRVLAVREAFARRSLARAKAASPRLALAAPRPTTLREAFDLPATTKRNRPATIAPVVRGRPVAPVPSAAATEAPADAAEPDAAELAELLLEDDAPDDRDPPEDAYDAYEEAAETYEAEALPLPLPAAIAMPAPPRTVASVSERGPLFDGTTGRLIDEDEPDAAGEPRKRTYRLPPLSLFDPPQAQVADDSTRTAVLEDTLASFGVGAKVVNIQRGPSITRYELRPERGVKISRISALADDLALALAATSVRIEAPIPGKSAVGIEVPNADVSVVAIREILDALPQRGQVPPLWMALGKDITGRPVFGDLCNMPHLLVAGATGSGKSVCLNTSSPRCSSARRRTKCRC